MTSWVVDFLVYCRVERSWPRVTCKGHLLSFLLPATSLHSHCLSYSLSLSLYLLTWALFLFYLCFLHSPTPLPLLPSPRWWQSTILSPTSPNISPPPPPPWGGEGGLVHPTSRLSGPSKKQSFRMDFFSSLCLLRRVGHGAAPPVMPALQGNIGQHQSYFHKSNIEKKNRN